MQTLNLTPEENNRNFGPDDDTLAQAKSGANWFYWIAGLSLINSLVFFFGGNWSFFAGLGVTQVLDAIVSQVDETGGLSVIKIVVFSIDLFIAGVFILCGFYANKLQVWAFLVGMILYLLDGLLLLVLGAYLAAGFHVFALYMIYSGLSAARKVKVSQNISPAQI